MIRLALMGAVLCALTATAPASAALVNYNIKVTGDGATFNSGQAPIKGLLLDFNLSFDDEMTVGATSTGLTINEANLGWTAPLLYAYFTAPDDNGYLSFGTNPAPFSYTVNPNKNTLGFFMYNMKNNPFGVSMEYSKSDGVLYDLNTTFAVTKLAAVPEPTTWTMMILGFGVVGYLMRRRAKVAYGLS